MSVLNNRGLFLTFCLSVGSHFALAQSFGTFTAAGHMTTPRVNHTATLLPDGRVLIAGGMSRLGATNYSGVILASAELYDPATGTFSPTGQMTTARTGHTATLLPNGKVLIVGGYGSNCPGQLIPWCTMVGAELYDPSIGAFGEIAKTTAVAPHGLFTATLLADGRVLLASDYYGQPVAELYDPVTGAFTRTADSSGSRGGLSSTTLLPDGMVYLNAWGAELYDPVNGTFSRAKSGSRAGGNGHTDTLLMSGKVLIAGGDWEVSQGPLDFADLLDPLTGTHAASGKLTTGRSAHTATLLSDSTVLLVGGIARSPIPDVERYDPVMGTFSRAGSLVTPRFYHRATLLNNGTVLITGGMDHFVGDGGAVIDDAEIYVPSELAPPPMLLTALGEGVAQGMILHATSGHLASSSQPAAEGDTIEIYLSGLVKDGAIPPQVTIGGRMAKVLSFGENRVRVRLPNGIPAGPTVPIRLSYIGRWSNEVTIAVKEPLWEQAIAVMKQTAGADSLNFWQWAWFWQRSPAFPGAPTGFGVFGSIDDTIMDRIIAAGGGDGFRMVPAEQWVSYYREALP